jgi:hypothetical protein
MKKCIYCEKEINELLERYFENDDLETVCNDCAEEKLSKSQYGWYDDDLVPIDPDLLLDDDLADVSFYQEKNGGL